MPAESVAKYCGGIIVAVGAVLGIRRFTEIEICKKICLKIKPLEDDITELKQANRTFVTEPTHTRELRAMRELTDQKIESIKDHLDIRFDSLIDRLDKRRKEVSR